MVENTNVLEEAGLGSSEDRDGDSNGTHLFDGKLILDMKAIEKCELIAPYVPEDAEKSVPEAIKPDTKFDKLKLSNKKNFTKPKTKEEGDEKSAEQSRFSRESEIDRQKKDAESLGQQLDGQPGGALSGIATEEESLQEESEVAESESIKDMIDTKEEIDQFENDDDVGFDCYEVGEVEFHKVAKHLADEFNFPARAMRGGRRKKKRTNPYKLTEAEIAKRAEKNNGYIYLDPNVQHPKSDEKGYPLMFNQVIFDCFHLKVIYNRERTGFEEVKEFQIILGSVIAGRYQVVEFLGEAAFSKAIQCLDLHNGMSYCLKVIENNKDYFDHNRPTLIYTQYIQ